MIRSPTPRKYQRAGRGSGATPADEPRVRIFTPTLPGSTVVLCDSMLHEPNNSTSTAAEPMPTLRPMRVILDFGESAQVGGLLSLIVFPLRRTRHAQMLKHDQREL